MKKKLFRLLGATLALSVFLTGCLGDTPPAESATPDVESAAPAIIADPYPEETPGPDYDWISGESPIPARRIGLYRQGIMQHEHGFECTDTGAYFMCQIGSVFYLLYGDHGSDTIIKLCGRPDCDHNNEDCNAYFGSSLNICYYGGYLYTYSNPIMGKPKLIRMDPDGSNRVTALEMDASTITGKSYSGFSNPMIWNGIFTGAFAYLDERGERQYDHYYYRLDGSMEKMEPANTKLSYFNDGNNFIMLGGMDGKDDDGFSSAEESGYYIWDPDDNSLTFLHNWQGEGYYGAEDAYYIRDGVIYRLNYAEDREEILLDTGLEGYETLACFPDCLVVGIHTISDESEGIAYTTLYFYNWAFESLGQVKLEFTQGSSLYTMNFIAGETAERIILCEDIFCVPRYYIEKSDFGTGNIEIHEYNMPDVDWSEIRG